MIARLAVACAVLAFAAPAVAAEEPPPSCGSPAAKTDPDPMVRFRCATLFNLRAMVADPADLDRGRERTPDAGDAALAAAHRHRTGEVRSLDVEARKAPTTLIEKAGGK